MELTRHTTHLPATVEELNQFILIGKEKIKAHQAKIRAIDKVGLAETARRAALQDGQDAGIAVIHAEAKLGELLKSSTRGTFKKGGETSLPSDVTKKTSHQAQTIAANPSIVEEAISRAIENDEIPTPDKVYKIIKSPHVSHNSGETEWYTPPEYIEAARLTMGSIDLDPASSEKANTIVKASHFFTSEVDGLKQEWFGNVWMNPPYGQPQIHDFCICFLTQFCEKKINQACILVNNATETSWFQAMMAVASAICFPAGRIKYLDRDCNKASTPLQGQAVLYFGQGTNNFVRNFKNFGTICFPSKE
jgi:phage N-6-adenine-methyltransferase